MNPSRIGVKSKNIITSEGNFFRLFHFLFFYLNFLLFCEGKGVRMENMNRFNTNINHYHGFQTKAETMAH